MPDPVLDTVGPVGHHVPAIGRVSDRARGTRKARRGGPLPADDILLFRWRIAIWPVAWFNRCTKGRPDVFSRRQKSSLPSRVRNFIWPRSGLWRTWRYAMHRLARMRASPHALAMGFAAGAFVSFTPLIGLHFVYFLRGNLIASALGTVLGNPVTFPFIWMASYDLGALLLGLGTKSDVDIQVTDTVSLLSDGPLAYAAMTWWSVEPVFLPILIGSIPLGFICGVICYWIVRVTVTRFKNRRKLHFTPAE
jgi:uncharacterized protein